MMKAHEIVIAMEGWRQSEPASLADDVEVGVRLPWIEVDGVRLRVFSAEVKAEEDGVAHVLISVVGHARLVYVDGEGEPLPGEHRQPEEIPEYLDHASSVIVP